MGNHSTRPGITNKTNKTCGEEALFFDNTSSPFLLISPAVTSCVRLLWFEIEKSYLT
jgi:hypothetical protein